MKQNPSGRYIIIDHAYVYAKASADDPRRDFAQAILQNRTYEAVFAAMAGVHELPTPAAN
jgi:hypothetical protein